MAALRLENMADVHSKETRSYNMSRIKSKNTRPEMLVRKFLFGRRFRYRLHDSKLPGKPDLVLRKYKTVIFINGCFWHGHGGCRYFVVPKTRTEWWEEKINKNISNDARAMDLLSAAGWKVIVLWECRLKKNLLESTLEDLARKITAQD